MFRSSECVAYTWDAQGRCCGVRIDRRGERCTVTGYWRGTKVGNQSLAQILEASLTHLKIGGETTVLIGGDFRKAFCVDMRLPKMASDLMHSAVGFELGKYSPLPPEDLKWGYRLLSKPAGAETAHVRVGFFPAIDHAHWLEAAAVLPSGVDMIIPTAAALDPLMAGKDVGFTDDDGESGFILRPSATGEREVIVADSLDAEGIFGLGKQPLAAENLVPGPLAALAATEQRAYAPSVLLAMYGVSPACAQDLKTWLPVPKSMKPPRNRMLKTLCLSLGVYILGVELAFLGGWWMQKQKDLDYVTAARDALQSELIALRPMEEDEEDTYSEIDVNEEMKGELLKARQQVLPMGVALASLTGRTDDVLWAHAFQWNDGRVKLELVSEADATEKINVLERTRVFDDFSVNRVKRPDNMHYTVTCRLMGREEMAERGVDVDSIQFLKRIPVQVPEPGATEEEALSPPDIPGPPAIAPIEPSRASKRKAATRSHPVPPPPPPPPLPGGL